MAHSRVKLKGTQRLRPPERVRTALVRSDKEVSVTLTLRGKGDPNHGPLQAFARGPVKKTKHLTVGQAVRCFSPTRKDELAIRRFAREHQLKVDELKSAAATMQLRGTVRQFTEAFGVELYHYCESKSGARYFAHEDDLELPPELQGVVTGVFGLDARPTGRRPGLSHRMSALGIPPPPVTRHTRKPAEFAQLYNFPTSALGKGQAIGLLEFGGGFRRRELNAYFAATGGGRPNVVVVEVPPGANRPQGKPGTLNADTEVYLDIEVAASLAPQAAIVVYFGDNTEQGWLHALQAAILDKQHDLSVISISWGQAEAEWSRQALVEIDRLFQLAAQRGITICCSSGDNGISELDGHPFTVAFPASSPHVLACGGTRLAVNRNRRAETVWNQWRQYKLASGGGVSSVFPRPPYQKTVSVPAPRSRQRSGGRGIPDVAANASSETGYLIEADHTRMSMGGTSAVAPLWAALIARLNEVLQTKLGFITPLLYEMNGNGAKTVRDIVKGFNGPVRTQGYRAKIGWDACTGLGSPDGEKILNWLSATERTKGRKQK
jgi:kumamolisin